MNSELLKNSTSHIRKGSKSFFLAAQIFEKETFESVVLLYNWCRYCDDEIDCTPQSQQLEKLQFLRSQTEAAVKNKHVVLEPFVALRNIVQKYSIPACYPLELINGMEMDVQKQTYDTISDLKLYCFRVAGVVGLMMAHIMRVSDEKALAHACNMGMAMQLTNISRDVFTDAHLGRIYLPKSWLTKYQVPSSAKSFFVSVYHGRLASVTRLLLDEADALYRSGDDGIRFLNFRARLAILSARYIYSDIGRLVRSRGARAWQERTYVSFPRKIVWVLFSLGKILWQSIRLPAFKPIPILQIWRHP